MEEINYIIICDIMVLKKMIVAHTYKDGPKIIGVFKR